MTSDPAAKALTLDLWHTLVYIDPESEERYMRAQIDIAAAALEAAPRAADIPPGTDADPRGAFEAAYSAAVDASQQGRTITPADQILAAGRATGRHPDVPAYLETLRRLVGTLSFHPAPGALGVLQGLKADGWVLGVVSNTIGEPGTFLRPMLERLGYTSVIPTWVFSDEQPWTKPAPEIFRYAAERLRTPVERLVHVGDGWVDIEGARRAGMAAGVLFTGLQQYGDRYRQLFLPAGWNSPPTPYRFDRWSDFPELLAGIR